MTTQTAPLTYNGFVAAIAELGVYTATIVSGVAQLDDLALTAYLPQALNYAELRIQRDLDLNQSLTSNGYTLAANSNVLSIPVGDFVTIQTLMINGVPLLPTSKEFIQNVYGTNAGATQPVYFAPYGGDAAGGNTSQNFLVGPYTDTSYPVSVTGTARLPSLALYATNGPASTQTTFISTWLPDLLIQASMIAVTQYQRQYGAGTSDPQMAGAFEGQYQNLLKGAVVEEARKRFAASAWSSMSPPLVATPGR